MKLDAVGVTSSNLHKTIDFYRLLGFQFPDVKDGDLHIEPITPDGSARLMIDATSIVRDIIGENPKPGNHSSFAIQYESPEQINTLVEKIKHAGYTIEKEPWDAFWGQRYAIVKDPDGYKIDLYAHL